MPLWGKRILNRSLLQNEQINELSWEANPSNETMAGYRIYEQLAGGQALLAAVSASTFKYRHRNIRKDKTYNYALTAVTGEGRESPPAILAL